MHLAVLIPAWDEAETVADVAKSVPRTVEGCSRVSVVVVDDGSSDGTAEQARSAGAEVIVHPWHQGLAEAFRTGRAHALSTQADIMVTLDADGQYDPADIPRLVAPIIAGHADVVVGDRGIGRCSHMPLGNRIGNLIGSMLLRIAAGVPHRDASSGFRALSRAALERMDITSRYTYTHEMLLLGIAGRMRMLDVPVTFRRRLYGNSKLVRTLANHIVRSLGTIGICFLTVEPLRTFLRVGALSGTLGVLAMLLPQLSLAPESLRWLQYSGVAFLGFGLQMIVVGFIAQLLRPSQR